MYPRRPLPPRGGPFPPPRRRRPVDEIIEEIRREIRAEIRFGLTRLYRQLRRDIRMAILEAKGYSKAQAQETVEKEEKTESDQSLLQRLFGGLDIDMGDILKYGGAALAGALAVLLITHIDDIYNFINQQKASGASIDQIKEALAEYLQEKLTGGQQQQS